MKRTSAYITRGSTASPVDASGGSASSKLITPPPVEQLRFRERDGKPSAYTRLYAQGVDLLVHKDHVYQQFGLHKSPPAPVQQAASSRQKLAPAQTTSTTTHTARSSVSHGGTIATHRSSSVSSSSIRHRSANSATTHNASTKRSGTMTARNRVNSSGGSFLSASHDHLQWTSTSSGKKSLGGSGSRRAKAATPSSTAAAKPQRRQSAIATQLLSKSLKIGPAVLHSVSSSVVFTPPHVVPSSSARSPRLSVTTGTSGLQRRPSGLPMSSPTSHHPQQPHQLNRRQSFQIAASVRPPAHTVAPPPPRSVGKPASSMSKDSPVRGSSANEPPSAVLVPVSRRTSSPLVAPNVADFGGMRRRPSVSPIRSGTSQPAAGASDESSATTAVPRPSMALLHRRDSKMDRLVEQITVLKNSLGLSDEDLQWKVESTKGNAYEAADRHLREAEELYDRLVYETQLLSETPCDEASALLVKRMRELTKQNQLVAELKPALVARQHDAAQRKKELLDARIASELHVAKGGEHDEDDDGFVNAQRRLDDAKQAILQTQNQVKDEMTKLNELLVALGKETDALAAACARFRFLSPDAADASAAFLDILRCIPECGGDKLVTLCEQGVLTAQRFTGSKAKELKRKESEMDKTLRDIEVWKIRKEQSKEFAQETAKRARQWKQAQQARNDESLKLLRRLVPPDIQQITVDALIERAYQAGSVLFTYDLALYIKQNKLLHWLVTHESDMARDNFLAVESASYFLNFTTYDIHELRAVCHVLPVAFDFDKDGKKAEWKRQFMEHVRLLVKQQCGETIQAGWDPVRGTRADIPLKPLSDKQLLNAVYRYPTEDEIQARIDKFELQLQRLQQKNDKRAKLDTLDIPTAKSEYLAIAEDARSEELQQLFGKATLIKLRDDAKQAWQRLCKTRDALKSEIDHAARQWSAQTPSYEQFLDEAAKIRALDAETRAARIMGPFPGEIELKPRARATFKKLSVEEEAQARRLELSRAIADRDKGLVDETASVAAAAATAASEAEEVAASAAVAAALEALVAAVAVSEEVDGETAEATTNGQKSDEAVLPPAITTVTDGSVVSTSSGNATVATTKELPPAENASFRRIKSLRVSTEVLRFLQNDFCSPRRTKSNTTLPISEILGTTTTNARASFGDGTATGVAPLPQPLTPRRRPSLPKAADDKAEPPIVSNRTTPPRMGGGRGGSAPRASVTPSEPPKPKSKALLALLEKQQQQNATEPPIETAVGARSPAGVNLDFLGELTRKAATKRDATDETSSQSRPVMAKAAGQLDLFTELQSRASRHNKTMDGDGETPPTPPTTTQVAAGDAPPKKLNFLEELALRAKTKARDSDDDATAAVVAPPPAPILPVAAATPRNFLDELKAKALKKPASA